MKEKIKIAIGNICLKLVRWRLDMLMGRREQLTHDIVEVNRKIQYWREVLCPPKMP